MNTVTVKSYTRQKPQKAPDPLQDDIDRRLSAKRAKANADRRVNEFRDSIGYKRRPSENETLFGLAVRKLDEFLAEKGIL